MQVLETLMSKSPRRFPAPQTDSLISHVSHRAMATDFVVLLPAHQPDRIETVMEALETLDEIESRLTVYRPTSEISAVNREASKHPHRVSAGTFDLLQTAVRWSQQTGGAFDVTAGPLIEAWGFTSRSGRKPTPTEIEEALATTGYQHIDLSPDERTIRFHVPGMSVNLGAIGKGYALDRLKQYLLHGGVQHFLIHGGNSSVIAHGNQFENLDLGWAVGIAHPTKPKKRLAGIWLKDAALATSGAGKQFFHHRGRRYGHVIDPRTGWPAGDLMSLTVIMNQATDADACATALFVEGSEKIQQWVQSPTPPDWLPSIVTVSTEGRQDDVTVSAYGDIVWADMENE